MNNHCVSEDKIVYADVPGACSDTADGSKSNPVCLGSAIKIAADNAPSKMIRLLSDNDYGTIDSTTTGGGFAGKSITIYGPFEPRPGIKAKSNIIHFGKQASRPGVSVSDLNTELILDGIVLTSAALSPSGAAQCLRGASLTLRRSLIQGSKGSGIYTNRCQQLTVDRTQVYTSMNAIRMESSIGSYRIQNSIIANNQNFSPMQSNIVLGDGSGIIQFNTITSNSANSYAGAFQNYYSNIPLIRSSLITGNLGSTSQFYPQYNGYALEEVTIEPEDTIQPFSSVSLYRETPVFVDGANWDYRLANDITTMGPNSRCCLGRAHRRNDVTIDLFGTSRSLLTDIGAVSQQ